MEPIQIEPYSDGSKWYALGGQFFVVTRTRGTTTTLRCHSDRCPARFHIRNGQAGPVTGEHDHEPRPWIPNRNSMFQSLKRRSKRDNVALNAIYEEEAARYPDAAPHLLFEGVSSSMRKWRRAAQPQVPAGLEGLGAALAEHPRHSGMLLATVSAGGATAVIMQMPGATSCLQSCHTMIVDGTFLTVPAGMPAHQVLTVHCVVGGHNFHPIIALMQNRRRVLYEAVFQRIWQISGDPHPEYIVTDFEPALQAALESVTRVRVQGCLFHYVQALLRRARSMGLRVARNSPGWRLVQLYGALALLPATRVPLALAEVQHIAESEGLPYNTNFNNYYVSHWMARVTPNSFSVHGSPHQTSNVAEAFHASLRRSLGPAPNVWRFLDVIAEKFAVSTARLTALRAGDRPPVRSRVRSYIRARTQMNNERALERGTITIRDFLIATSRQMDVGVGIGVITGDVPEVGEEIVLGDSLEPQEIGAAPEAVAEEVVLGDAQGYDEQEDLQDLPEIIMPPIYRPPVPEPEDDISASSPEPSSVELQCNICMEGPPSLVLRPCGHLLCSYCRERVVNCPFCRIRITEAYRFYYM